MSSQLVVGVTGGIATGKSTVTRILRELGAVTFSADEASRAVLTRGGPVIHRIRCTFGNEFVRSDGTIDRGKLGELVFRSESARMNLNKIMHPPIRRLLYDQIESAKYELSPRCLIAVEIPLLYEGNLENWFERILVVTTSETIQIERLAMRARLTRQDAQARIHTQMPLAYKVARATYVVDNDGPEGALAPQVESIWNDLKSPQMHA